ncbi:hypothetical protein SPONL_2147 [uncultured Candidatus Thioglobus sp.]|nr:hypothetical protein SPONL_2147 [uncultured Candidatus Thioglobus sp.]
MNKKIHNIIEDTLSHKEQWLSTNDPFSAAFEYALKKLHKENLLITSGEFSLSHLKLALQTKTKSAA